MALGLAGLGVACGLAFLAVVDAANDADQFGVFPAVAPRRART
jgi:NADH:ubiquinone oxidoreductase subunit B-like Fe-S oxidoreductase